MKFLDIHLTYFKTWFAQNLQYRFALLIWLIGFILEPVVYSIVWITVAQTRGGSLGGFSQPDFAAYFIASMLLNHLTFDWHFFEMEPRIRNGLFSALLLRPVHPIHSDLMDNIVYKTMTFPFMFAAATGLYFFFHPTFNPQAWALALFVPVLILGFAMRFLLEWTIALASFWTTRIQSITTAYIIIAIFLSGRMAPLSLLPAWVQSIAMALPFRLWISFPIELLLGRITFETALQNMALQVLWLGAFFILFRVVWHRGMKRYSAVGA